jgi:hypothetical protein
MEFAEGIDGFGIMVYDEYSPYGYSANPKEFNILLRQMGIAGISFMDLADSMEANWTKNVMFNSHTKDGIQDINNVDWKMIDFDTRNFRANWKKLNAFIEKMDKNLLNYEEFQILKLSIAILQKQEADRNLVKLVYRLYRASMENPLKTYTSSQAISLLKKTLSLQGLSFIIRAKIKRNIGLFKGGLVEMDLYKDLKTSALNPDTIFKNPYVTNKHIAQYIKNPFFSKIKRAMDAIPIFFQKMILTCSFTNAPQITDATLLCGSNYFELVNDLPLNKVDTEPIILSGSVGDGTPGLLKKCGMQENATYINLPLLGVRKKIELNYKNIVNSNEYVSESEIYCELLLHRLIRLGYDITDNVNIIYLDEIYYRKIFPYKINIILENQSHSTSTNMQNVKIICNWYGFKSITLLHNPLQQLRALGNAYQFLTGINVVSHCLENPDVNIINVFRCLHELATMLKYNIPCNLDIKKYKDFENAV